MLSRASVTEDAILSRSIVCLCAALMLTAAGCPNSDETTAHLRAAPQLSSGLQKAVTVDGIREHLEHFQAIADANGGVRASGTPGYDKSARYVAEQLRASGYEVHFQEFVFPAFVEKAPPIIEMVGGRRIRPGGDFVTMLFSASGDVTGEIGAVDLPASGEAPTSGCDDSDFTGFSASIALMVRSNCFFRDQAANAQAAGADAALIMPTKENADQGVQRGTLTPDVTADIPVLGISNALGARLMRVTAAGKMVRIAVDATTENRSTSNVIAQTNSGNDSEVVMIGAHLDSVPSGPGINDNGSGSATVLEIAQELALFDTAIRVRFAFWGAEEYGLLGSIHYVQGLDDAEVDAIDAYLNFDMLGSSNFVRFVYDGHKLSASDPAGSVAIQHVFERHFEELGLPTELIPLRDRSDHALFAAAGIDVGGLFSGADELKTKSEARDFGGRPGELNDPCYHLACDTLDHVNFKILDQMADAAADAVARLAGRA